MPLDVISVDVILTPSAPIGVTIADTLINVDVVTPGIIALDAVVQQGIPGQGVPPAGAAGAYLVKNTTTSYDTSWVIAGGGPPSGAVPAGDLQGTYPSPTIKPASLALRHVQASAATTWNITHTMSFWPNVIVVDSTGRVIIPGTVQYNSMTSLTLTFSAAVAGEAYLS